jgi:hypothetical protein
MKKIKIKFIAKNYDGFEIEPRPIPASKAIPKWWRDMTPYVKDPDGNPDGKKFLIDGGATNVTPKKCKPMLDAITQGYLLTLKADVQIRQIDGSPRITWRTDANVFEMHGPSSTMVVAPHGYYPHPFKYVNTWKIVTPKGYSTMISQPSNRNDSPFMAIPAVVDTDKEVLETVPILYIQEGFEGIVEKGTPIVQVTPFKRVNWEAEYNYYNEGEYKQLEQRTFAATLIYHYTKFVWTNKRYD